MHRRRELGPWRERGWILLWATVFFLSLLTPDPSSARDLRIVELLHRSRREIHRRLLMTEGGGDLFAGDQALRQGEWASAIESFRSAAERAPQAVRAVACWGEAAAYRGQGRLRKAELLLRKGLKISPSQYDCSVALAELCRLQGRHDEAERILRPLWQADPAHFEAGVELALTATEQGRAGEARAICDTLVDYYNTTKTRNAWHLYQVGRAAHLNGDFHGAIRILERAVAGKVEEALLESASVFLDKGQTGDAADELRAYRKLNPHDGRALLGLARVATIEGPLAEADRLAREALREDPSLLAAHGLLADLALMDGSTEQARQHVAAARKISARHPATLARLAACHYLDGDTTRFAAICRRVLTINPQFGELYEVLARACMRLRRSEHAEVFIRKAIDIDPRAPRPRLGLASLLLARAEYDEARRQLETVHALDPFSSIAVNWLKVLDLQEEEFVTRFVGALVLRSHETAEAVWRGDLEGEALRHFKRLEGRLGWAPSQKLHIEIMPDHRWFAARVRGLPFAGAMGVCFGSVLAIDSPRAMASSFDWSSTLAHELAHAFHLLKTSSRIPIWLTEGLAQVEEDTPLRLSFDQALLRAVQEKWFYPMRELGRGFSRPRHRTAQALAYRQAHMAVTEFLRRKDWKGIRELLARLADGEELWKAIKAVYGLGPEELDVLLLDRARAEVRGSVHLPRYGMDEVPGLLKDFKNDFREEDALHLGLALVHGLDPAWADPSLPATASHGLFALTTTSATLYEGLAKELRAFGGLSGDGDEDEAAPFAVIRGYLHALGGRPGSACRAWHRATVADPRCYLAWKGLAFAAMGRRKDEATLALLRKTFELCPKDGTVASRLAEVLRNRKDFAGAGAVCEQSLAVASANARLWVQAAAERERLGRRGEALEAVHRALRVDPFDPVVLMLHARLARDAADEGELTQAWERIGRWISTKEARRALLASLAAAGPITRWQAHDGGVLFRMAATGWPLLEGDRLWRLQVAALPECGRAAFFRGLAVGEELRWQSLFQSGLRDASVRVRLEAALGLAALDQSEAIPHLIHALRTLGPEPRIQVTLERLCCANPGTTADAWHGWWRERRRLSLRDLADEAFLRGGYDPRKLDEQREAALYLVALDDAQWYIRSRAARRLSGLLGVRVCRGLFDRPWGSDDSFASAALDRGRARWKARVASWRRKTGRGSKG